VPWHREHEAWLRPIKPGEFRVDHARMCGQRKILKEVQT
jgi:hypothetical protein